MHLPSAELPARSRISRAIARASTREFLFALGPFVMFVAVLWAKLSYFNFPPTERLGTDWNAWRLKEAVQAWIGTLAALLIICSPLLLLRPIARFVALAALDLLATALVFANLLHFRFYGDVLSVSALAAAEQIGATIGSLVRLLRPSDGLLFLDLMAAALVFPLYLRAHRRATPAPSRFRGRYVPAVVGLGVLLLLLGPVRIVALDRGDTFRYNYLRLFGVRKIGLLNYHGYEAGKRYLSELLTKAVPPEDRKRALDHVAALRREGTAPSELFGLASGKNVIFLMVESLHAFPLGLRVDGQEITPTLNDLTARSLHFTNFYGQTWEGTTSDGEFTSLHSLHPLSSGAVATRYPHHEYRGIPAILAERGYATMSAHAYYGSLWNMRLMHPALGFRESYFRESYRMDEQIGMGLSDGSFLRQTSPRLRALREPFMAYIMTLSSHHPWQMAAKYRTLSFGDLEGTSVADYLHAVHYVDTAIGQFVGELREGGLWDRTLLVLYGDHRAPIPGPEDKEKLLATYAGYPARDEGFDARYWGAENRLAFIIHLPGDAAAGRRPVSAGHLDIAPTVLNLLGVANHQMVGLGRDLLHGKDQLVVMRNGSFVLGDTVCVRPTAELPRDECRSLATNATLSPARFQSRLAEARRRLATSDLIITGNLIPAVSAVAPGAGLRFRNPFGSAAEVYEAEPVTLADR
ncbi:MAG: LTA synthase family protein [Gemmatimonadetes bacterium]|nr:LTA synthase family protein [Gemmatimonadota bacterium]